MRGGVDVEMGDGDVGKGEGGRGEYVGVIVVDNEEEEEDDEDNEDDEDTESEDNQPEERPNYYSTELFIRHSINRNSTSHNNRTTQATNEPHSSNTLQTSRFALVRLLDNLVRRSYVN